MLQHIWRRRSSWAFAAVLVVVGSSAGCGDDSNDNDNDNGSAGKGSGGAGGAKAGGSGGGSASNITPSDKLKGTAEESSCHSYTEVKDDMCQGWFCGVTEAELKAEVDPKAKCGGDVALLCKGSVTIKVAECARMVKIANLTKTNDELKPLVRDCVYNGDAEIKEKVPADCLDCTIDVAACAADNCISPCLGDDTLEECDACRLENGCDQAVFPCGQLPSPLD